MGNQKTKLNEDTFIVLLDEIRKPNGDKKINNSKNEKEFLTFDKIVCDNWAKLELIDNPNPRLFERILIGSIEDIYQNCIQKGNRAGTRSRDVVLASFGLLKGYSYHTKDGINTWLEDRYENYLSYSDFTALQSSVQGGYQRIKKCYPHEKEKLLGLLMHDVSKSKKELSKKVLEKIENKTYKEYLDENNNVLEFELPEPCYTLKNFEPVKKRGNYVVDEETPSNDNFDENGKDNQGETVIDTSETLEVVEPQALEVVEPQALEGPGKIDSAPPHPPKTSVISKHPLILIGCILGPIIAILILALIINATQYFKIATKVNEIALKDAEKIVPDKIEILNKNILLLPGEDDYLKITTVPYVELSELSYYSTDDEIAKPENLHSPHIIAAKNAIGEVNVIVHGAGDSIAKDTATITVRESNTQDFQLWNDNKSSSNIE